MLRILHRTLVVATLFALALPCTAEAKKPKGPKVQKKKIKGEFLFQHGEPVQLIACPGEPIPGEEIEAGSGSECIPAVVPDPIYGKPSFVFFVDGDFVGDAKHLKAFGGTGYAAFYAFLDPTADPVFEEATGLLITGTFTGEFEWVASDGSTLSGEYIGHDTYIGNDPLLGPFGIHFDIIVDSGTGKYEGATGVGTADGLDDPFVTHAVTADFELRIAVPKGKGKGKGKGK